MINVRKFVLPVFELVLLLFVVSGCGSEASPTVTPAFQETAADVAALEFSSPAFESGQPIPIPYTCDGEDVSPPLSWDDSPAATQSFALIFDDPDAPGGTWVLWVLYDIPGGNQGLPEAVPAQAELSDGSRHGQNSWDRLDYGGPCPPSGTHRYFFKLYALDTALGLEPGADKARLQQAMEGHIIAGAELMGTYSR
jgi:Raf kinase inhibitor-like YbhB/YbcL family protein